MSKHSVQSVEGVENFLHELRRRFALSGPVTRDGPFLRAERLCVLAEFSPPDPGDQPESPAEPYIGDANGHDPVVIVDFRWASLDVQAPRIAALLAQLP